MVIEHGQGFSANEIFDGTPNEMGGSQEWARRLVAYIGI